MRRFWIWAPSILLDPFDINERVVQPMLPDELKFVLPWSPDWASVILVGLIVWAGILTFHEQRKLALPIAPKPDWSARDAFRFLMLDSKWALGKNVDLNKTRWTQEDWKTELFAQVEVQLRDAASIGKLLVWGRPQGTSIIGLYTTMQLVDCHEWRRQRFDYISCLGIGETAKIVGNQGQVLFDDVKVNKAQIFALWPKATIWEKCHDKYSKNRIKFCQNETQLLS